MTTMIPSSVRHDELLVALEPLLELIGVDSLAVFYEPGIRIENGWITTTVATGACDAATPGRIVTVGDDPKTAEYGIEVRIRVSDGD